MLCPVLVSVLALLHNGAPNIPDTALEGSKAANVVPLVEVVQGCFAHEQPQSAQELAIDKAAHAHREYRNTASRSVTNKLPIGEAVLHGKAACSKAVLHGGAPWRCSMAVLYILPSFNTRRDCLAKAVLDVCTFGCQVLNYLTSTLLCCQ